MSLMNKIINGKILGQIMRLKEDITNRGHQKGRYLTYSTDTRTVLVLN
jgi:hypothetical protein